MWAQGRVFLILNLTVLISVAARSKAWVCGRPVAGIGKVESRRGHGCLSLVSFVCCQVQCPVTGRSPDHMSPTECGVSECKLENSTTRRPGPNKAVEPRKNKMKKET